MRTERIVAATALVATLVTGTVACNGTGDDSRYRPNEAVVTAEDNTSGDEPTPTPEPEDTVNALNEPYTYENDVAVTLSGFKRGVSSDTAAPENTEVILFTVDLNNQSTGRLDMNETLVYCMYGNPGQEGQQVFDTARNIGDAPDTQLLAGNSVSFQIACAMPKEETVLQIEIAPAGDYENAIFTGKVVTE